MQRTIGITMCLLLIFVVSTITYSQGLVVDNLTSLTVQNADQIQMLAQIDQEIQDTRLAYNYNIGGMGLHTSENFWALEYRPLGPNPEFPPFFHLWDVRSLTRLYTLEFSEVSPDSILNFTFSPDEQYYAVILDDVGVVVGDLQNGERMIQMDQPEVIITEIKFDATGRFLGFLRSGALEIWDMETMSQHVNLPGSISTFVFTSSDDEIITGDRDGQLLRWDISDISNIGSQTLFEGYEAPAGFRFPIHEIRLTSSGDRLFFFYEDTYQLWDLNADDLISEFDGYLVNNQFIVERDGDFYFADTTNAEPKVQLPESIGVLDINSDNTLAIGITRTTPNLTDDSISLFLIDVEQGLVLRKLFTVNSQEFPYASFSPDDNYIITLSQEPLTDDIVLSVWGIPGN